MMPVVMPRVQVTENKVLLERVVYPEGPNPRRRKRRKQERFKSVAIVVALVALVMLLFVLIAMATYATVENRRLSRELMTQSVRLDRLERFVGIAPDNGQQSADPLLTKQQDQLGNRHYTDYNDYNNEYIDYQDYHYYDGDDDEWPASGVDVGHDDITFADDNIEDTRHAQRDIVKRDVKPVRNRRRHRNTRANKKTNKKDKLTNCKVQVNSTDLTLTMKGRSCTDAMAKYIEMKIEEKVPMTTIHLNGHITMNSDTLSRLHQDPNQAEPLPEYDGDMYSQAQTMAFWTQADWSKTARTNKTYTFRRQEGSVEVKKSGIYFIYAQVHFLTSYESLTFHVRLDQNILFTCKASGTNGSDAGITRPPQLVTEPLRPIPNAKGCWTGGVVMVQEGQKFTIWNRYVYPVYVSKSASFWGIIRLS